MEVGTHHTAFLLLNQRGISIVQLGKQLKELHCAEASPVPVLIRCLVSLFLFVFLLCAKEQWLAKVALDGRCLLSSAEPLCAADSPAGAPPPPAAAMHCLYLWEPFSHQQASLQAEKRSSNIASIDFKTRICGPGDAVKQLNQPCFCRHGQKSHAPALQT